MHRATHPSTMANLEDESDLEDARAVIALLKEHPEALRRKGVPVEEMIRDIEQQIEAALAAREKARNAQMAEKEFERVRADHRRELDALVALLPPNLADGMSTVEYLHGIHGKGSRATAARQEERGRVRNTRFRLQKPVKHTVTPPPQTFIIVPPDAVALGAA